MDYTYYPFAGFVMKIFVFVTMLKLIVRGVSAIWFDTDWDPEDSDDDNYRRLGVKDNENPYSNTYGGPS